jgi:hypothetical protein
MVAAGTLHLLLGDGVIISHHHLLLITFVYNLDTKRFTLALAIWGHPTY